MWIQDVPGGEVTALAHSPDGTLYAQDAGRWYTAWDAAARAGRRLFRHPAESGNHFPRMFVSAGGRYLVSNLTPPLVWDLAAEALHAEVPDGFAFAGVSPGPAGDRVECVSPGWLGLRSWYFGPREPGPELRDWPVPGTIKTHHRSPDGRRVALLNWSGTVTVCDEQTRAALHRVESPLGDLQHCRFAPGGEVLVMYAADGVAVWDLPAGRLLVEKVGCDRPYWVLAFHPTRPVFAARRKDGLPALFDLRTGAELRALDFALGERTTCVTFSPDGLTCAVGGSGGRFAVFDVDV